MKKIICFLFGHKWKFIHKYGIGAEFKCNRCNGYTKDFIFNKPYRYKKSNYYKI